MNSYEKYQSWLNNEYFDQTTRDELAKIGDNQKEIEERFYKDLEFGTGGLRGIIGSGTNRMNVYTVRKSSQGLANYVLSQGNSAKDKGIVIAYDSRRFSYEFAIEAAKVFCANGIKTYLFDELRPTPELSFAVRKLNAFAGIVITASHNPKEYNGYKVYGMDGAQLSVDASNLIIEEVNKITDFLSINVMDKDSAMQNGLLTFIGSDIDNLYMDCLKSVLLRPDIILANKDLKIVFTPLHGTGNKPVRRILSEVGFENVFVVKEQELPDENFSTIKYPNPEERDSFNLAIDLATQMGADIIIGTDPDADRIGVLVKLPTGKYEVLTGNQTGCLLLEYILSTMKEQGKTPTRGFAVKTIVTTEMARQITNHYGVELVEVLTGFKFIGEQIYLREEVGNQKYIFGFEESYGYLAGTFARDKDAVVAAMLIAEMAAFYKHNGKNLYDGLLELYQKYGYTREGVSNYNVAGKDGLTKIDDAMTFLREKRQECFDDINILAIRDYQTSLRHDIAKRKIEILNLPKSNVLYYELPNNSWFCVRPSGTESKLKIYYGCVSESQEVVDKALQYLKTQVESLVSSLLS